MSEDELCHAFADKLASDESFQNWLLNQCGFSSDIGYCRLMHQEQLDLRSSDTAPWWRHWFTEKCRCDGCSGKETDIFAVFERSEWRDRFALHIECKLAGATFTSPMQAPGYRLRAECWAGKARFLYYKHYATVLLAPKEFLERESEAAKFFDYHLSFTAVAEHLPVFAS